MTDKKYPPGSTAKTYTNDDGDQVSLDRMVEECPRWAVNIIRFYEVELEKLEAESAELKDTRTEYIRSTFFAIRASPKIRREFTVDQVEVIGDLIFKHSTT